MSAGGHAMAPLRRLRIGRRLGLAFGALLLILLLLGGFGVLQQQQINRAAQELGHRWLPSVKTVNEIGDAFNQARRTSLRYLLDQSDARSALLADRDALVDTTIPELFLKYERLMPGGQARARMDEVRRLWAIYLEADRQLIALSKQGAAGFPQARALAAGASADTYVATTRALGAITAWSNERAHEISRDADREYAQALYVSIAAIVSALALGIVLARTITASITGPLRQGVAIAEQVAGGDLTLRVEVAERDEVADLLRAMQAMSGDLSVLVGKVRGCSSGIALGSHEIALGNADLSQRTEEQASNLEETAASMEQFTSTARSNADIALQARELAASAIDAAIKGGTVVQDVVRTMDRIEHAARKIADINGLIDGIAFQTNILALNAAVEAARAGSQGRGFAVVASEVRSLAQRSAHAAREIKTLIDDSVATVGIGTEQASMAGRRMQDIVAQVDRVGLLIASISDATSEQSSGIALVGGAIGQLDQVTQQNAALVEQSAAAADALRAQADQLAELVAAFRIGGEAPNGACSLTLAGK